jgi:hypothetical protein
MTGPSSQLREDSDNLPPVPSDWKEQIRSSDPLLGLADPGWYERAQSPVQRPDGGFTFSVPSASEPGSHAIIQSVGPSNHREAEKLCSFLINNFQQDDDAQSRFYKPWERIQQLMADFPPELRSMHVLDTAAVVVGVKPVAIIDSIAIHDPLVRALFERAEGKGLMVKPLPEWWGGQMVVGLQFRIETLIQAGQLIEGLKGSDYPDEYFRAVGAALGYSNAAVEYFMKERLPILRNKSLQK